ncbi:Na+/H+ antiporter subunit E [Streptomyces alkaliphilus]|uniref:Na+/H+ antiporter subunit E n=1 Tax=Streptomyces alkaliphilus TaxID=1472722 RepID=UPI0011803CE9|nr:Na+/H+ antiporter subunit E [Streptomyces alkaliphilus]MQS06472.1 cation transporter [Streptomyces alkaliphilus]
MTPTTPEGPDRRTPHTGPEAGSGAGTGTGTPTPRRIALRVGRAISFVWLFALRFVQSNVVITVEILTPRDRTSPGIVELPLRCRSRAEIATFSSLINLTPGTLTLEVRRDPPTLWVHGTHTHSAEEFRHDLWELETRMLTAWRPVDEPLPPVPPSPRGNGTGEADRPGGVRESGKGDTP